MKELMAVTAFSLVLLSGCGEDGPLNVGVSLGGTGLGPGSGSSLPPAPPIMGGENGEAPLPIIPHHFEMIYPAPQSQDCDGIQRTYQFIDKATNKVIQDGSKVVMDGQHLSSVLLRITVKNTTAQTAYEYIDDCKPPIKLINTTNGENKELETNPKFSCDLNESIHIYQPQQCKTFLFDFNILNTPALWSLRYQTQYSFVDLKPKEQRSQCPAFETNLKVQTSEETSSTEHLYLDDGTNHPCITVVVPPTPIVPPPVIQQPVVQPLPPVVPLPAIQPPIVQPPIQLPIVQPLLPFLVEPMPVPPRLDLNSQLK